MKRKTILLSILIVFLISCSSLMQVNAFGGGGGGGCSPRPAPPCSTMVGCFTSDNIKDSGMTPDDFGFYLSQMACIPSTHDDGCGGEVDCNCNSGVYVEDAKQRNPDQSSGACGCIAGTSWDPIGKCCGDDLDDNGRIEGGSLCVVSENFRSSNWVTLEDNAGKIFYSGSEDLQYSNDGEQWLACGAETFFFEVDEHLYACSGQNDGRVSDNEDIEPGDIVECCGSDRCNSDSNDAGVRLRTGDSLMLGPAPEETEEECPEGKEMLGYDNEGNVVCEDAGADTANEHPPRQSFDDVGENGKNIDDTTEISCTDTTWSPDPSTVDKGQIFTQTSNCGNTRRAVGTKETSPETEPKPENEPAPQPSTQTFSDVRVSGEVLASGDDFNQQTADKFCERKDYERATDFTFQTNPNIDDGSRTIIIYCDGTEENTLCYSQERGSYLNEGWWRKTFRGVWIQTVFNDITCTNQ